MRRLPSLDASVAGMFAHVVVVAASAWRVPLRNVG